MSAAEDDPSRGPIRLMHADDHNGTGGPPESPNAELIDALLEVQRGAIADQTAADADQTAADADQTSSDADQTASETDQASADSDQRASDLDQATADHDRDDHGELSAAEETAYGASREARVTTSFERMGNRARRATTAHERDVTASERDRVAEGRDEAGAARDDHAAIVAHDTIGPDETLLKRLVALAAQAAADREHAAADRARAAADRENAALERARLEEELHSAHLDELTGAYRREMGRLAISNEIDRARRSDGRFVLAFVDVDLLKAINDNQGHAAGDRVLQTVVKAIRTRLRSFDPIMRYGGDEFVCGLSGTDLAEATRRFEAIRAAIRAEVNVGISFGLAALTPGETVEQLTERADAAMLEVKAHRHRSP